MLVFLLWIYMVAASEPIVSTCPKLETLFDKTKDCNAGLLCDTPILSSDKKSFICPAEWNFEARVDRSSKWNRLASVKCEHGLISATRIGKMKSFDYEFFRCAIEACSVDTKAAFKASVCLSGDTCQEANPSKEPLKLSCPIDSALEVQKPNGRWIELSDNRCVGSTLTSTSYDGEMKVYRCRTLRKCDVNRYYPKTCGLKEKCSPIHSTDYICDDPSKIQVSFTNEISWQEELQVVCDNDKLSVKNTLDIPIALRCVADAVCEVDEGSLDEKTCEKGDACREIAKSGTTIKCPNSAYQLEHHVRAGEPWQLINAVDCYNTVLIDRTKNIQGIKGLFRCRKKRGNDMAKYRDDKECEPTKKCVMPVPEGSNINYKCPIDKNKFKFNLQAKLTDSGPWIDIDSATFKNEVFVIREKDKAVDNEFIPIQFRCIREATCEVDLTPKFSADSQCPSNDHCEIPKYNAEETKIVCPDEMAIEFQSAANQPWKELAEVVCYNQIMKAKLGPVDIDQSSIANIRCRKLRMCDIDKYYGACDKKFFCSKPNHLIEQQCQIGHSLQFKYFDDEPWANINKLECKKDRFVLIDSTNTQRDEIPIGFQCAREKKCDLEYYTIANDKHCNANTEICDQPTNGTSGLECTNKNLMTLRVKPEENAEWVEVDSIVCKNDEFEVMLTGNKRYDHFPLLIQCKQLKCTTCAKPCVQCSNTVFAEATKTSCATFGCAANMFLVIGELGENHHHPKNLTCLANNDHAAGDVWTADLKEDTNCLTTQCMQEKGTSCADAKHCTQYTPLASFCKENHNCGTIYVNNFGVMGCSHDMILRKVGDDQAEETKIKSITCNLTSGFWEYTDADDKPLKIKTRGYNTYCKFPDCDFHRLFPKTEAICAKTEICGEPIKLGDGYWCGREDYNTYYRNAEDDFWSSRSDFNDKFLCCKGEWGEFVEYEDVDDENEKEEEKPLPTCADFQPLPDSLQIKCARKKTCTEYSPIISQCPKGAGEYCEFIRFTDHYKNYECQSRNFFMYSMNKSQFLDEFEERQYRYSVYCNRDTATWEGSTWGEYKTPLGAYENIVCWRKSGVLLTPFASALLLVFYLLVK